MQRNYVKCSCKHIFMYPKSIEHLVGLGLIGRSGTRFTNMVYILNPAWISNYTRYLVWDEIIYTFPNFSTCQSLSNVAESYPIRSSDPNLSSGKRLISGGLALWSVSRLAVVQGWGLLKLRSFISPLREILILQKYRLDTFNHVHICQVSPQLSCSDTCQIWTSYHSGNHCFHHSEKLI